MPRPPEFSGIHFTIQALELPDGSCPAGDFLDSLDSKDGQKLDVLFEKLGDHRKISNKEKFKKVEGSNGIFEFKSFQIRIFCFFTPDKKVILTHGVIKKDNKIRKSDISRAEKARESYLRR